MDLKHKIASVIIRNRVVILVVMLLLAIAGGFLIGHTRINYDLNKYLSEDTMTKRSLHVMEEEFGKEPLESEEETELRLGDLQSRIGAEIPVVMIIVVLVVLGMMGITSHAWLEPLVILFVLAVSVLINMGTNWIFPEVSFVTFAVCAVLQLALSIDYAIMLLHAFNAYRDIGLDPEQAMTEALAECFMRISSSALTTVAGLMSLIFMSFTIGFDIGLVLSKGILISMLGVFLLMPAVTLVCEKPLRRTKHRPLSFGGDKLARGIDRYKKPVAAVLVLLVLGGLVMNSMTIYSFSNRDELETNNTPSPLVLLLPNDSEGGFDRQTELVTRLESLLRDDGSSAIDHTYSIVTEYTPDEASELVGLSPDLIRPFYDVLGFGEKARVYELMNAIENHAFTPDEVAALTGRSSDTVAAMYTTYGLGAAATVAQIRSKLESLPPSILQLFNLNETAGMLQKMDELNILRSKLVGPHYARVGLTLTFAAYDQDFTRQMDAIFAAADDVYGKGTYYVTGLPMSIYDIDHAFQSDLIKVNLITFGAILLIVTLSFRSLRMSALLVFVIEGAIWITMGISRVFSQPIFFISYLICLSIQMGATIDYGILLSDQYRSRRAEGLPPRDAMVAALQKALPTILTSGVILILAGFAVGKICTIYYIYSIGLLVSRGALVSALLVMTLLPSLLLLGDRFIVRKKKG